MLLPPGKLPPQAASAAVALLKLAIMLCACCCSRMQQASLFAPKWCTMPAVALCGWCAGLLVAARAAQRKC